MKVVISIKPDKSDVREASVVAGAIIKALERRNYKVEANTSPYTGNVSITIKNPLKKGDGDGQRKDGVGR